jgi:hypothetical protein
LEKEAAQPGKDSLRADLSPVSGPERMALRYRVRPVHD